MPAADHPVRVLDRLAIGGDELAFDWPLAFDVPKDKPVLLAALARAAGRI